MRIALGLVASVLLILAGCGDDMARGMVLTGDGRWVANTASRAREVRQSAIADALATHLAPHWRALVRIDELPEFSGSESGSSGSSEWIWSEASVAIELIGDGQAKAPVDEAAVRAVVAKDMAWRVHPRSKLRTKIDQTIDPARFAQLGTAAAPATVAAATVPAGAAPVAAPTSAAAAVATPPPATPTPAAAPVARTYVIQAGDTLAAISAAFYGTSKHWRRILDANPGLDPENLRVGQTVAIPPAP